MRGWRWCSRWREVCWWMKIMCVVDTPIVLMNMYSERLFWCFIWSGDYNHYLWILCVVFWGCNISQSTNGWTFSVEDSSGHHSAVCCIGTSNQGPKSGLILRWMFYMCSRYTITLMNMHLDSVISFTMYGSFILCFVGVTYHNHPMAGLLL